MRSLKQTIMQRDGISASEANILIAEARDAMSEYLENGDFDSAENICQEYFGLEPDFLMDLL